MVVAVRRYGPGLLALGVLSVLAVVLAEFVPFGNSLIVVVALGILIGNTNGLPDWAEPGVGTHDRLLEGAIVLLGVSISVDEVLQSGIVVIAIVGFAVVASIVTVEIIARLLFEVPEKTASLLASGSGICGVSAIAAVAGSIRPTQEQIAYAVATVLLFDAVTLVVYPAVGNVLGLADKTFGIWAGATMFSTGPASAAGFAYSPAAGEWAVLAKITRNSLIGVVALGYALWYRPRGDPNESAGTHRVRSLVDGFPVFVLGFLLLVVVANLGVFSPAQVRVLTTVSDWLFLLAFAGLGLTIDVAAFRDAGVDPAAVVTISLTLVSTLTLVALTRVL